MADFVPRSILAVLGNDPDEWGRVLPRACELADDAHGELTIAALATPRWHLVWLASMAGIAASVPPVSLTMGVAARDRLAQIGEFAPTSVALRTLVIEGPPRRPLRRLLASGRYDLLVIGAHLASRRRLARLPIPALVIPSGGTDAAPHDAGSPHRLVQGL